MTDADVLAMRGLLRELHLKQPGKQVSLPRETEAAIGLDPTNVTARLVEVAHRGPLPLDVASRVVAANPLDWRAWWLLWGSTPAGTDADEAHHKVCELLLYNPGWLPDHFCPDPH